MKAKFFLLLLIGVFTKSFSQSNLQLNSCLEPFYHGVASGDPLSDRVIIWTRVTPVSLDDTIDVNWKVATDTTMTTIVNSGVFQTNSNRDFTVKVDVDGLNPGEYYYYQFEVLNKKSQIGRTKTAPNSPQNARFGIVSCANLEAGFFNVYKVMNERNDMDAILCLGDYIYEYETGGYSPNPTTNRFWQPVTETLTLEDYRARYSTYRLDPDLRRSHQLFPWICIWDDHETANDSWPGGAENHNGGEGNWADRMNYGKKAFFEWLPIRELGNQDPYQIYRTIPYGNLIDLIMLDTRLHGRDVQAGTTGTTVTSESRELLGSDQRLWMNQNLINSTAQWKIIAQQVMMAPLSVFGNINGDQWNGYPAERNRFFNFVNSNAINNIVILTGDIHSSWANDLPLSNYNSSTGSGSIGVEFVTPSVTSPGLSIGVGTSFVKWSNPHIKYIDFTQHGFILLDINPTRTQADWFYVSTINIDSNAYTHAVSYKTENNQNRLKIATSPTTIPNSYLTGIVPNLCPFYNTLSVDDFSNNDNLVLLALYPNPTNNFFTIHYNLKTNQTLSIAIIDSFGKLIKEFVDEKSAGVWTERYPVEGLSEGLYHIRVKTDDDVEIKKLIIKY